MESKTSVAVEWVPSVGTTAKQAAITAGYGKKNASTRAFEMMKNPTIASEIDRRRKRVADKLDLRAENVLRELNAVIQFDPIEAFDDDGRVKPLSKMSPAARKSIANITIRNDGEIISVNFHQKLKAMELAAKHLGLLVERVDVTSAGKQIYDVKPFKASLPLPVAEVQVIEEKPEPEKRRLVLPRK